MTIYLIRHGETVWNRAGRFQGRADSPLTLAGTRLAIAYGEHLREQLGRAPDVEIHTSPLGRARQTAALIADVLELDTEAIRADERLAEHDVGALEGCTWDEVHARFGLTRERFSAWDFRPPSGESRDEILARARSWLAEPCRRPAIAVSHGGFSRLLRCAYLGLTPAAMRDLPSHVHGRLFVLARADTGPEARLVEIGHAPADLGAP